MKIIKTDNGDLTEIISGTTHLINGCIYKLYNYNGNIYKYAIRENERGRPKSERTCKTDEGKLLLSEIVSGSIHKFNDICYKVYINNVNGKLHFNKVLVKEPQKRGPKKIK